MYLALLLPFLLEFFDTMTDKQFPTEKYVAAIVEFLDTIQYQDDNYSHSQRLGNLRYVYRHTAKHFSQPVEKAALTVSPKRLQFIMRTGTLITVYCWTKLPLDVMVDMSVYWVYMIMLDDASCDALTQMTDFAKDLFQGNSQKHRFFQRVNTHLTSFLRHYGGFCSLSIIRGTLEFFQACWIEQKNFNGFPGSCYFPNFLRRLGGLGSVVGATLFPIKEFDEQALFSEITTAIAQIEPLLIFCNDMISFYKEFDSATDQLNLVNNLCYCNGLHREVAFEQIKHDTLNSYKQLMTIFEGKDPKVEATIHAWVYGYITWHLCDPRFRMQEIYEQAAQTEVGMRFRHYYQKANKIGAFDFNLWAVE